MCFRPADVSGGADVNKCPECGRAIQTMGGIALKACPFCKCDLTPHLEGLKQPGSAAHGAPAMPGAPSVPGAPKPPIA